MISMRRESSPASQFSKKIARMMAPSRAIPCTETFAQLPLFALLMALDASPALAQVARDRAVEVNASVQETPPAITLQWNATGYPVTGQKVFRRLKDRSAGWNWRARKRRHELRGQHRSAGVTYEYRVSRALNGGPGTANGYLHAGIRVPLVAERGRVILLVDDTMAGAARRGALPLCQRPARRRLGSGAAGRGAHRECDQRPRRHPGDLPGRPGEDAALILFGHVPVPYSGDSAIDGHPDHFGAWPTDVYYGDMDGTWTDSVNDTGASGTRNDNMPGIQIRSDRDPERHRAAGRTHRSRQHARVQRQGNRTAAALPRSAITSTGISSTRSAPWRSAGSWMTTSGISMVRRLPSRGGAALPPARGAATSRRSAGSTSSKRRAISGLMAAAAAAIRWRAEWERLAILPRRIRARSSTSFSGATLAIGIRRTIFSARRFANGLRRPRGRRISG